MHILLITRHYPPEISGGSRRPFLYAQAIRELGHKVTLVTPFELNDEDSITVRSNAIDSGLKTLHEIENIEPSFPILLKLKNWLRTWIYWPDENIPWARSVTAAVKHKNIKADWIFTTSPPESIHISGSRLSKYLGIPWVAEMRDTWIDFPHRKVLEDSKIRAFFERSIAKRALSNATAITTVSEIVMKEANNYLDPNTPKCIISHFSDPPPAPHIFDHAKINLVHSGGFTLSDRRRELEPLIEILNKATHRRPNLALHIAGPLTIQEQSLIEDAKVSVVWHGSVSLKKSRALQAGADGLILCTPADSHALPGKYAEYVSTGIPILYLGGGKWIELVEDSSSIKPLETAIFTIKKSEFVRTEGALTHSQAARTLINFLETIETE